MTDDSTKDSELTSIPGRPRGKALRLTPEQLDAQSEVDAGDAVDADEQWKQKAPPAFKSLLDTPTEP